MEIIRKIFEDKFVVAECEEKDNTLTIHTDKQKVINYENVEYENKKFFYNPLGFYSCP